MLSINKKALILATSYKNELLHVQQQQDMHALASKDALQWLRYQMKIKGLATLAIMHVSVLQPLECSTLVAKETIQP